MDCSTPGSPVHHQLLERIQTHVHRVGDAIPPSHPLPSPSPPAFYLSQHPLEKGMANHFSVLALRAPWTVWRALISYLFYIQQCSHGSPAFTIYHPPPPPTTWEP